MRRPRIREDLSALSGYHSPQLDVEVRLNTNESPEPPPAGFNTALAEALKDIRWNRYPDRSATQFRERLAKFHGVDPSQIFVANGSNEVIQTLLLTFAGPGRGVLTFEPTYALHSHIGRITGSTVYQEQRDSNFRVHSGAAAGAIEKHQPAVTFLCSPNNPTGMVDPLELVEDVIACKTGIVVVDEAYGQFARHSAQNLLGDEVPLVVTRTFSKTWAMAAARIGYLIGPPWLVSELEKVVLPYHLDAFSQAAGLVALDFGDEMLERVERLVSERALLSAALEQIGCEVWPSEANFVLFRPAGLDAVELWQGLVAKSVLVRDCSSWPRLDGCLRVSIGTATENQRFIAAMQELKTQGGSDHG